MNALSARNANSKESSVRFFWIYTPVTMNAEISGGKSLEYFITIANKVLANSITSALGHGKWTKLYVGLGFVFCCYMNKLNLSELSDHLWYAFKGMMNEGYLFFLSSHSLWLAQWPFDRKEAKKKTRNRVTWVCPVLCLGVVDKTVSYA